MNERIKELMMVALQEQYGDAATPGAREAAVELVSGWGAKFAELIVRECVSIGNRAFLADNSVVPTFPTNQIKEHFGIK